MKISNQIIIIIIFLLAIFIISSDYKGLYGRTVTYLKSELDKSSSIYSQKVNSVIDVIKNSDDKSIQVEPASSIKTPGALLVSDNFLTNNIDNIKLSSKNVISITNKYRTENGNLVVLIENSKLDFSAEKKLQDMFVKGYFEHVSPEGVGVGDLGNQIGYEYIIIGENLALGNFKNDQSLVDAWMASPGHRANILNKRYTEIGVAVGRGVYNGKNVWISVQHFGLPKSSCPAIDGVLKGIISLDEKKIKEMESDLSTKRKRIDSGAIYGGLTTSDQVDQYNILVIDYNKIILDIKEKINTYNKQIHLFNDCVAEAK